MTPADLRQVTLLHAADGLIQHRFNICVEIPMSLSSIFVPLSLNFQGSKRTDVIDYKLYC